MTSFQLKMIAITTMLIDHIGVVIYPDKIIFRIIGRLAFPIFAFLITEGYLKTSNFKRYLIRLSIFALISQYPFWEAFGYDMGLNIFFTLALGLIALKLYDKYDNPLAVILIAFGADLINTDYGMFGILVIFLIYLFRDDFKKMLAYIAGLYLFIFISSGIMAKVNAIHYYIQLFALTSFVFISLYNGKRGYKIKYLFYIFYPAHLLILSFL